jgi:hypothetical protein
VAIYRLLQNSPLGPEELKRLADAYERTLITLRLKDRDDPFDADRRQKNNRDWSDRPDAGTGCQAEAARLRPEGS